MKHHSLHALAAFLILTSCPAQANDEKSRCIENAPGVATIIRQPSLYVFHLENDLFNGTDSNYTSGVKFSWVSANLQDFLKDPCLPHWVRQFNKYSEALHPKWDTSRNMVVTAGQAMFTPRDRYRTDLIRTERPYAGWLYLGLGYNARNERELNSVEINMGVVGPAALAKQSQDFIHDLRGKSRFYGWENQLRNEPGIQLVAERKRRVAKSTNGASMQYDVISHYGVSLGNVKTHLTTGVELRIGSRIPDDFGTSPIRPTGDSNAPLGNGSVRHFTEGGMHAFISADASLVARDIFLDGNTFTDSHHVAKKHLVGDIAGGVAWQWHGGKITYAHYIRSKEYVGQGRTHGYGSISLSLEY